MAHVAERILVPARVGDDIGLFFVARPARGVTLERQDVTNHEPQFVMHLDGALVGDEYRIGELAEGASALRFAVQHTIVGDLRDRRRRVPGGAAASPPSTPPSASSSTAPSARSRPSASGWPTRTSTRRRSSSRCCRPPRSSTRARTPAWRSPPRSSGRPRAEAGSCHAALHVHGGICIDLDYPIHRYFQWVKQLEFTLGSETEQLRDLGRLIAAS